MEKHDLGANALVAEWDQTPAAGGQHLWQRLKPEEKKLLQPEVYIVVTLEFP